MKKIIMTLVALSILASVCVQAKPPTDTDVTGLVEQKAKRFDYMAVHPDSALASINTIYIAQPTLSYEKRWLRDNKFDVDKRYRNRIAKEYSQELKEALTKAISKNENIRIVDKQQADAAILVAQLKNVRINGPDNNTLVKHLVNYAGDAHLEVGIYHNDKLITVLTDYEQTRDRSAFGPEPTSRVQNHRDFSILFSRWGKALVNALWP